MNDGTGPNINSVNAALAFKPHLEAVAKGSDPNAVKAKEMLAWLGQVEELKNKGWPHLDKKLPFAPSLAVDLNTPEAQAAAEEAYKSAIADWEKKVSDSQGEYDKALATWKSEKSVADKKFAKATAEWEKENGANTFKFKNLTDAYDKFCEANGIESKLFWQMAAGQGGSSGGKGSCRMKILELLALGADLQKANNCKELFQSVGGASTHYTDEFAFSEFKTKPSELERYRKAYNAMKSLTQMLLCNSSFVGNFKDRGVVRLCRTESKKNVIKKYGVKAGVPTVYPMGPHESWGTFHAATPFGNEAVFCDVPYSRISSMYFLRSPSGDMYLGDSENESGVNGIGLPKVYWKTVSQGTPLTQAYDFVDKAFGLKTKSPLH